MALLQELQPPLELLGQLVGAEQVGVSAQAKHPGDDAAWTRVAGEKDPAALVGLADLPVAAEVPLDLPRDPLGDQDLGHALLLAELPVGAVGVRPWIEVGRPAEVVLGLSRVGDLAAYAREAEHANRLALVGVAEQIELTPLEQQVIGINPAGPHLVALHRVVVEQDRLVAEDRRLHLRQARRQLVTTGGRGDAECDGALLRGTQRAWTPPADLLQSKSQRLGVREFPVQQAERGLQRGELLVRERDRRQMEVLRPQRVVLLLGRSIGRPLDGQLDAQRFEL
jgi:hypothetical protein